MHKPTTGSTVHYVLPDGRCAGEHRPAIVVTTAEEKGWGYPPEDHVVQLQVLIDGTNDVGEAYAGSIWATSVKHDADKAPGTWHWPESVLIISSSPGDLRLKTGSRFTEEALADIFSYHAPTPDQLKNYDAIRSAARVFAEVIVANTPPSADQTTAIRKLRECVMVANGAVALEGKY